MKKAIVAIIVSALVCLILFYLLPETKKQIRRMKTGDTMGQIDVAIGNTFRTNSPDIYNPVAETKRMFPKTSVTNGQIMDAWGKPIKITIQRLEIGFKATIASAGPDGKFGTPDDLVNEIYLSE